MTSLPLHVRPVCQVPVALVLALVPMLLPAALSAQQTANTARPEQSADALDQRAPIPADLLSDEVVENEFGVNEFTAPSIHLLFDQLDELGRIAYGELKRDVPDHLPADRSQIALSLGTLIADGFAAVQANQLGDIEVLGRSILEHAEALGTGERVRRHSRNLIQRATEGSRDELREGLAATQEDVEAEMVELRDVDLAHLISLGGWLRALQLGCHSVNDPFESARVRELARLDVLRYYRDELDYLANRIDDRQKIDEVRVGLAEMERLLDRPRSRDFTRRDLDRMTVLADALVRTIDDR